MTPGNVNLNLDKGSMTLRAIAIRRTEQVIPSLLTAPSPLPKARSPQSILPLRSSARSKTIPLVNSFRGMSTDAFHGTHSEKCTGKTIHFMSASFWKHEVAFMSIHLAHSIQNLIRIVHANSVVRLSSQHKESDLFTRGPFPTRRSQTFPSVSPIS